ncbi:von Willebrand factor type A [Brevundimonas subvibrioides ATCC 15264]|uniref:von Willebrand factor type A n=2 Tax=Brevundimonas subvibrioides TaxID=74313 RepID=D9QND4_BRESC|nr:von Willebrand factor type A [Brevundimonas subvibrioides ATCC 15264]
MRIMKRTVSALKTFGTRFSDDRRGNVAMMFALALPPMMLMTLGGVDIARVSTVRMNVQDALDAATLAAARSQYTDNPRINAVGLAALQANLAPYGDVTLDTTQTNFRLNTATGAVEADAKVNVRALVANIFLPPYGQFFDDQLPANAHSEVLRSNNRIEVALVIDNTGSMDGAKLTNTKTAAIDLINRLEAADGRSIEQDAIKISLVPFSMTVRVAQGGTNTPPSFMSNADTHTGGGAWNSGSNPYSAFDTAVGRFTLFGRLNTTWGGCVESRPQPYDIRDTAPSSGTQATMFVPYFAPDEPDRADYPNHSTWQNWQYEGNDYLDDGRPGSNANSPFANTAARTTEWFARVRSVSRYSTTPRNTLNTGFGPNRGCDLQPIIRLTDNYTALRTAVNNMIASGNTNVPLGTMWGWHTLSPNAPFGDGRPYGTERLKKIIIIMTDGANVMSDTTSPNDSTYNGLGYIWQNRLGIVSGNDTTRRTRMDNRFDHATAATEDMCGNMKDKDIEVYTVAVQVDSTAQTLLRRCATDTDHYFPVDSAAGIGAAFDRIAGAIENLRISR